MYYYAQEKETAARLENLLILNAENARSRGLYRSDAERTAFEMMRRPVNIERAFAVFGGFLGTFPVAALYLGIYFRGAGEMGWVMALFVLANILTAVAGYFLGALVGKIVRLAQGYDWVTMTVFLTFVGGAWGMASGFIGGLALFIIGAFFGGAIGLIVGALTLPVFGGIHRLINTAGYIDRRQLIALAAGISLTASAYILGL